MPSSGKGSCPTTPKTAERAACGILSREVYMLRPLSTGAGLLMAALLGAWAGIGRAEAVMLLVIEGGRVRGR
ncbi:hypothetical protein MANAM107_09450 [Actinomyces capricornis]|uniref:Uncharacterized protein n=1 Tax=Actinomyces capricornis TaxID=2755559 RepID=A0ABN6K3E3_9ACTO|nr:hypothetical protein MANAM107_09450 [Actinomyces capricornis]